MIRWSALNVSRRKPAKAESCANEKNSARRLYDNLAGVVFPDNRIFYKAYS